MVQHLSDVRTELSSAQQVVWSQSNHNIPIKRYLDYRSEEMVEESFTWMKIFLHITLVINGSLQEAQEWFHYQNKKHGSLSNDTSFA